MSSLVTANTDDFERFVSSGVRYRLAIEQILANLRYERTAVANRTGHTPAVNASIRIEELIDDVDIGNRYVETIREVLDSGTYLPGLTTTTGGGDPVASALRDAGFNPGTPDPFTPTGSDSVWGEHRRPFRELVIDWWAEKTHYNGHDDVSPFAPIVALFSQSLREQRLDTLATPGDTMLLGLGRDLGVTAQEILVAALASVGIPIPPGTGISGSKDYAISVTLLDPGDTPDISLVDHETGEPLGPYVYQVEFDKNLGIGPTWGRGTGDALRFATLEGGGGATGLTSDVVVLKFRSKAEALHAIDVVTGIAIADLVGDITRGRTFRTHENPLKPDAGFGLDDLAVLFSPHRIINPIGHLRNLPAANIEDMLRPSSADLAFLEAAITDFQSTVGTNLALAGRGGAGTDKLMAGVDIEVGAGVDMIRNLSLADDQLSYTLHGNVGAATGQWVGGDVLGGLLGATTSISPDYARATRDLQLNYDLDSTSIAARNNGAWFDLPAEADLADLQPESVVATFTTEFYGLPAPLESRPDSKVTIVTIEIDNPTQADIAALAEYFATLGKRNAFDVLLPELPPHAVITVTDEDIDRGGLSLGRELGAEIPRTAEVSAGIRTEFGTDIVRNREVRVYSPDDLIGDGDTETTVYLPIVTNGDGDTSSTIFLPIVGNGSGPESGDGGTATTIFLPIVSNGAPTPEVPEEPAEEVIEPAPEAPAPEQVVVEPVIGLKVRTSPDWDAAHDGVFRHGSIAELTGETFTDEFGEVWAKVTGFDAHGGGSTEGWVSMTYVSPFTGSGETLPDASRDSPQLETQELEQYVVQPGDTLIDIAERIGITPSELIELNSELADRSDDDANHVHDPHWIFPGDIIHLPVQPAAP